MHKPTFNAQERAMIDRFKADLPSIIAGRDSYRPASVDFETRRCSKPGCNWFQFQAGLCHTHHVERKNNR